MYDPVLLLILASQSLYMASCLHNVGREIRDHGSRDCKSGIVLKNPVFGFYETQKRTPGFNLDFRLQFNLLVFLNEQFQSDI